jgi:exosortase/archaeosortase family protein
MRSLPRLAVFLGVFAGFELTWQQLRGTAVEYAVIHFGTVRPAAGIVDFLSPELHVRAVGFSVRAVGGGVNVLNGCEGFDAVFLLVAAFAAAMLPLRAKLRGLLLGIPLALLVNQLRIVILFYAYRRDPALFDFLHAAAAPVVIVVAIACYFDSWLRRYPHHAIAAD